MTTNKKYKCVNTSVWAYDVLKKEAKEHHRSITGQLDTILEEYVERSMKPQDVPPKEAPTPGEIGLGDAYDQITGRVDAQ